MGRQSDDTLVLVDINDVGYLKWDEAKANILKESMTGRMSNRQLAEAITSKKGACSHQNIAKLLNAQYDYIAIDTLNAFCTALSIPISNFVNIYQLAPVTYLDQS
jgi:DNA-binding Xre family transcriptional regulator